MNGCAVLGQDSDNITIKHSEYMKRGDRNVLEFSVFCLVSNWKSMPSHLRERQSETSLKFIQLFQQTPLRRSRHLLPAGHFVVSWRSCQVFL